MRIAAWKSSFVVGSSGVADTTVLICIWVISKRMDEAFELMLTELASVMTIISTIPRIESRSRSVSGKRCSLKNFDSLKMVDEMSRGLSSSSA